MNVDAFVRLAIVRKYSRHNRDEYENYISLVDISSSSVLKKYKLGQVRSTNKSRDNKCTYLRIPVQEAQLYDHCFH